MVVAIAKIIMNLNTTIPIFVLNASRIVACAAENIAHMHRSNCTV